MAKKETKTIKLEKAENKAIHPKYDAKADVEALREELRELKAALKKNINI